VNAHITGRQLSRRALLLGGAGAATAFTFARGARPGPSVASSLVASPTRRDVHLAATDGWVSVADPANTPAVKPFWPDPYGANHGPFDLYVFGFRDVSALTAAQISAQRGKAQISAPQLVFDEGSEVRMTLSNLGLQQRPDLVDGHTIHWHGFVNAVPLFDGVPELSISVPIGRDFTYFYRPHDPGTYMYHCHFEDVEHVQMGMTGMLFVRPAQNGNTTLYRSGKYAYNDGDGSTGYDREFGFMLNEIFVEGHYRDAHIQTTDWTDFNASFATLNGRTYPDTLAPNGNPMSTAAGRLQFQPITSLITANAGDRVLLRLSSLGYQSHTMTVDGFGLTLIAKDAMLLKNGSVRNYLNTSSVDVAPGESRDVIFTAPDYSAGQPGGTDPTYGPYNTYLFYDRDFRNASNAGGPGPGGMVTEIRVYRSGLPAQADSQSTPNA
jgi:FtsP/CotA-like multicopper oxidase with cupredoxin domain